MTEDLIIEKKYAKITDLGRKGDEGDISHIRIYCSLFPNVFEFQIRTFKPIDEFEKGVKRQMLASASLTIEDVEHILEYMKNTAEGN